MGDITARTKHECTCGQEFDAVFIHNGYAEQVVFYLNGKGYRRCPQCGRRLVYLNPSII
jgi:hypothetical protein